MTWTEPMIALGTVGTAAVAAAGLWVSVSIAKTDRGQADERAHEDREAAAVMAAQDRAANANESERRHFVDLMLRLGEAVAEYHGTAYSSTEQKKALQKVILLLHALPPDCATAVRLYLVATNAQLRSVHRAFDIPGWVGQKLEALGLNGKEAKTYTSDDQLRDIAYDIANYLDRAAATVPSGSEIPAYAQETPGSK